MEIVKLVIGHLQSVISSFCHPVPMLLGALILPGVLPVMAAETTIYVNKFFEVREHDQPTKYVFDGDTRVARVTGSLSTNTRIQRFRLYLGWNLLSLAVTATNAVQQMTNSQFPILNSQSVVRWNQPTLGWLPVSTNETLAAGTILWLHATTNATLALTGTYTDPTNRPLPAGGSFQPSAGLEALPLMGERAGVRAAVALSHFDAVSQLWQVHLPAISNSGPGFPAVLAPGQALFINTGAPTELEVPETALRIRYYHQDHLGSSSVMTDAQGALVEETAFYPFGVPRHDHRVRQIEENYKFTQKERDRESGLQYFGKRFYAPTLARWLSTDPLEEKGGGLNLYAYVNQNPLKYHDPDGMEIKVGREQNKSGGLHYQITVKAVLIDSSGEFSGSELRAYAARLESAIKTKFTGSGVVDAYVNGRTSKRTATWSTKVDVRAIGDWKQLGSDDHVFNIVQKMSSRGETSLGAMHLKIAARTLRRTPDFDPSDRHYEFHKRTYVSWEGTAMHELGHSGGLGHDPDQNLMRQGDMREGDNQTVRGDQIEAIYQKSQAGQLNQREDHLKKIDAGNR